MDLKNGLLILTIAFTLTFCHNQSHARGFYLDKGEKAPFAGMLLDGNSELKARTAIQQNEEFKEIVENQYDMINNLHQDLKTKEAKIFILEKNQDNLYTKILYFIGGALVGGMVVKEIKN